MKIKKSISIELATLFFILFNFCGHKEILAQRKTLWKDKGVTLSYEVEDLGTCTAIYFQGSNPSGIKALRYTFYVSNDNPRPIKLSPSNTPSVRITLSSHSNLGNPGRDCPPKTANYYGFGSAGQRLDSQSEISSSTIIHVDPKSAPPRPGYSINYVFADQK